MRAKRVEILSLNKISLTKSAFRICIETLNNCPTNLHTTQKASQIEPRHTPLRKCGGGGHLILCPSPIKMWGGLVPSSPPPPRIDAHDYQGICDNF
ncbi:hypothetical protein HOLleu_35164 [Holothuria leucospilota]|uniref:Uncharacterized protein n=1 Tax=Holothuria leucospilota TaxID=206669 RepID=A0A9Q0YPC6_HOLLE|nr:hypothetical protein HOLleu_35164 [Holothuria leucospilota]